MTTVGQKVEIEEEDQLRVLFMEDPTNQQLNDPHLSLLDVYQNQHLFYYEDETDEEMKVPKLLTHFRQVGLKGMAIVEKNQFLKNWKEFTQGCLDGLKWDNVFVAGGSVLGSLSNIRDGYRASDIDLFLYGFENEQQANDKLREIYEVVVSNTGGKGDVIRTNRALTILCPYPYRHLQIILRLYRSPAEVLVGFDVDSCCVGFDSVSLWCTKRFKRAITKQYNLVNVTRRSTTYEQRLYKYSKRGFAVAVPGLDKSRVNPLLFQHSIKEVQGLSKLILYDYNTTTKTTTYNYSGISQKSRKTRKLRTVEEDEEGSDYNNDLPIPWGPQWQTESILNLLNTQNKAKFFFFS